VGEGDKSLLKGLWGLRGSWIRSLLAWRHVRICVRTQVTQCIPPVHARTHTMWHSQTGCTKKSGGQRPKHPVAIKPCYVALHQTLNPMTKVQLKLHETQTISGFSQNLRVVSLSICITSCDNTCASILANVVLWYAL
jgi:hypothetical protein